MRYTKLLSIDNTIGSTLYTLSEKSLSTAIEKKGTGYFYSIHGLKYGVDLEYF